MQPEPAALTRNNLTAAELELEAALGRLPEAEDQATAWKAAVAAWKAWREASEAGGRLMDREYRQHAARAATEPRLDNGGLLMLLGIIDDDAALTEAWRQRDARLVSQRLEAIGHGAAGEDMAARVSVLGLAADAMRILGPLLARKRR